MGKQEEKRKGVPGAAELMKGWTPESLAVAERNLHRGVFERARKVYESASRKQQGEYMNWIMHGGPEPEWIGDKRSLFEKIRGAWRAAWWSWNGW